MTGPRLVCIACGRKSASFRHSPYCSAVCRDRLPGMPPKAPPRLTKAERLYLEWKAQRDAEGAA